MKLNIIVVTHNSDKFINWALAQLALNYRIIIVDSGSINTDYLTAFAREKSLVDVVLLPNVGFSKANNTGIERLDDDCEYVLFLNPDATIELSDLRKFVDFFDLKSSMEEVAAAAVPLIKYDFASGKKINYFDSLGIYFKSGHWFDEVEIENVSIIDKTSTPEALCGAFILASRRVLNLLIKEDGFVFDPSFFMYKEDIDLSLRLKKHGVLYVWHDVSALHCRGWSKARKDMPRWARVISARNDLKLAWRYKQMLLPYSLAKYFYVLACEDVFFRLRG